MEPTATEQPIVTITTRIDYEEYKRYVKFFHLKLKNLGTMAMALLLFSSLLSLVLVAFKYALEAIARLAGDAAKVTFVKPALIGLSFGTGIFLLLFTAMMLITTIGTLQAYKRLYKTYQRLHEADCVEALDLS